MIIIGQAPIIKELNFILKEIKSGENLTIESLSSLASRPPSRSLKNFSKNSDLYVFLKVRW